MSDSSAGPREGVREPPDGPGAQSPAPDFFDRLLARHAPGAVAGAGAARVRPRLAGPFERPDAARGAAMDAGEPDPLWPTSGQPVVREGELMPGPREVQYRTELERTLLTTERQLSPGEPGPRAQSVRQAAAPLLRPAATVRPVPAPAPDSARRTSSGRERPTPLPAASPASVPGPPGTDVVPLTRASALRPSAEAAAAARDAVRQSAGRRGARSAEQVVHVQIGRLEVTAAGPRPPRAAPRPSAWTTT